MQCVETTQSGTQLWTSPLGLDARMVLKSLEQQPMTLAALERHWYPTWSQQDLKSIIELLRSMNLISVEHRVGYEYGHLVDRYRCRQIIFNS